MFRGPETLRSCVLSSLPENGAQLKNTVLSFVTLHGVLKS